MAVLMQWWLLCGGHIVTLLYVLTVATACPGGCTCSIRRSKSSNEDSYDFAGFYGAQSTSEVEWGHREVHCVNKGLTVPLDPSTITEDTYYIDLSENNIRILSSYSFNNLDFVQKLNLSGNEIVHVQSRAFYGLEKLEELDLSRNNLGSVNNSMFEGLASLEKLNISHNRIATIASSAFERLISLRRIDFQSSILMCDCNLRWMVKWEKVNDVRIHDNTVCAYPQRLAGDRVHVLKRSDLGCDHPMQLPTFTLTPSGDQVVFIGDEIRFVCRAMMVDASLELRWWKNGKLLADGPGSEITESVLREEATKTSTLVLLITGEAELWNVECKASSSTGSEQLGVLLRILDTSTSYCLPTISTTNRGEFKWPRRVAGATTRVSCPYGASNLFSGQGEEAVATRQCSPEGQWEEAVTGKCAYADPSLRLLEKYSLASITNSTVALTVARKVEVAVSDAVTIQDSDAVVFVGRLMEKFQQYPTEGVGQVMLNIASSMMEVDLGVLAEGQREDRSCSKIVLALEKFAASVLNDRVQVFHHETTNIAMQAHRVTPAGFVGMTCASFVRERGKRDEYDERHFKCNVRNITSSKLNNNHSMIEAAIQLPASIFKQASVGQSSSFGLQFLVYKNARLFPPQDGSGGPTQTLVTGSVISSNIDNIPFSNLTDSVVLMFRHGVPASNLRQLQPGYWDFAAQGQQGAWKSNGCVLTEAKEDMVVLKCNHLTNFALLRITDSEGTPTTVGIFSDYLLHPSIYITTFIFAVLIFLVLLSYTCCYRSIRVKAKAKHSLINICLCLLVLALTFAGGISRTSPDMACKGVGMALHYFSICCLLWVAIAARNLMKALSKSDRPPLAPGETLPPPRPVIRFYFVGWGIPMIIVGITAAASKNLANYGGTEFCWISDFTISLVSFFAVAALIIVATCIFFIITTRRINASRSRQHLGRTQMYEIPSSQPASQERQPSRGDVRGPPTGQFPDQFGSRPTVTNSSYQYPPLSEQRGGVGLNMPAAHLTDQFGSRTTMSSSHHPAAALADQHLSVSMNLQPGGGGDPHSRSMNQNPDARSRSFTMDPEEMRGQPFNINGNADPHGMSFNINANADPRSSGRSRESLSSVTSCLLDQERPHAKQLRSLLFLFLGFLGVWSLGAMVVVQTDTISTIFMYLYSGALVVYGLFIFINHCALRNDVLLRWKRTWGCAQQEAYTVNVPTTETSQHSNGHIVIQRRPSAAGSVDSGVTNQSHNTNHSNPTSYRSGSRLTSHCNYVPGNVHTGTDASIDSSTQETPRPFYTDRRNNGCPPQGRYSKSRNRSRNPRYSRHSNRQSRDFSDREGGGEMRGNAGNPPPSSSSRSQRKEYTTALIVGEARRTAEHSDGGLAPSSISKSLDRQQRNGSHAGSLSSVDQAESSAPRQHPRHHRSRNRAPKPPPQPQPSPLPEEEPLMQVAAEGRDTPPPPSYDEVTERNVLLPVPEQPTPTTEGEPVAEEARSLAESQPATSSLSVNSDKKETSV